MEFPEQGRYLVGWIREEGDTEHGIEEPLHGQAFVQGLWREERLSRAAFRDANLWHRTGVARLF